jgi:hypothetical protein
MSIGDHHSTPANFKWRKALACLQEENFEIRCHGPIADIAAGWVALSVRLLISRPNWSEPPAGGFAGVTPIANFSVAPSPRCREAG